MGYGYRDSDWIDPPEIPPYAGRCGQCEEYTPCPGGCGWGTCNNDGHEFVCGEERGCEDGAYAPGYYADDCDEDDGAYDRWRDMRYEDMPGFEGTRDAVAGLKVRSET